MDEQQIRSRLAQYVSGTDKDEDWAWNFYQNKREQAEGLASDGMTEEKKQDWALKAVQGKLRQGSRSGGTGEDTDVEVLAIGHTGYQRWGSGKNAHDVLIAFGIVQPDVPGEDHPQRVGVFICEGDTGADIGNIKDKFSTLNTLRGNFTVQTSDELSDTYVLRATDNTRVEDLETDASDEALRNELHKHIDESDAANIANLSSYLSLRNADGYPAEFGGDLKRLHGQVIDHYVGDGYNYITLVDDSVSDTDELGSEIVSDRARSPGLTCWVPDDFMNYGDFSELELYGPIQQDNDGQISMNVAGIIPIFGVELDEDVGSEERSDAGGGGGIEDEGSTTVERIE